MPSPPAVALTALSQDTFASKGNLVNQIANITLTSVKQNGVATMSTMEVSSLICRDFINTFDATLLGEVTATNITGGNVAGSRISSFDIVNGKSMNTQNMNVSSVNGQIYPPPAAVSSINGQLSTLTVSSFVSANNYGVGAGQTIGWAGGNSVISQLDVGGPGGAKSLNIISDGGVNIPTLLSAPFISSVSTVGRSMTAVTGNISSLYAAGAVIGGDLNVNNDMQCLGNITCSNEISASQFTASLGAIETVVSDVVSTLQLNAGQVNASEVVVSSFNGRPGNRPGYSTMQTSTMTVSGFAAITSASITAAGGSVLNYGLGNINSLSTISASAHRVATSSLTVSSLNGTNNFLYNPNPTFSTITANTVGEYNRDGVPYEFSVNFYKDPIEVGVLISTNCNYGILMAASSFTLEGVSGTYGASLDLGGGELLNISTINGFKTNEPAYNTVSVTGAVTAGAVNTLALSATSAVATTGQISTLNTFSMSTTNLQASTIGAQQMTTSSLTASTILAPDSVSTVALRASSINGALLTPVLLGFSTASVSLTNDSDLIVNAAVGDATLASENGIVSLDGATGIQILSAATPSGSATFIDGINWSTLVAVVKGLSSFT